MTILYIFDFDDTLAMTNSHVIVISQDGSRERLDSRSFAKYRDHPGDTLDFSEFKQASGKLIDGVVEQMESAIQEFGLSNVFIVTARSWAEPVKDFLAEFGVTTPKIIATTGSEGKARWLTQQLARTEYVEVKVYEDCRKNIKMLREIVESYNEEIGTDIKYSAVCILPDGSMELLEMKLLRKTIRTLLLEATEYDDKFKELMESSYETLLQALNLAKSLNIPTQDLPWTFKSVQNLMYEGKTSGSWTKTIATTTGWTWNKYYELHQQGERTKRDAGWRGF